jgi:hypothetical protein
MQINRSSVAASDAISGNERSQTLIGERTPRGDARFSVVRRPSARQSSGADRNRSTAAQPEAAFVYAVQDGGVAELDDLRARSSVQLQVGHSRLRRRLGREPGKYL